MPTEVETLDDAGDERADGGYGQGAADPVDAGDVLGPRGRHQCERPDRGECRDRHVDEERRAPRVLFEQPPREQGPERDRQSGRRGPRGDCAGSFRGGEHGDEQGQGCGHDHRGADAHRDAGADHFGRGAGEAAEHGAPGEDGEAGEEGAPAAVTVAEDAREQHQRGVGHGVAVDDPLQVGAGQLQFAQHARRRDDECGVGHHDDQQAQAEHREAGPPARIRAGGIRGRTDQARGHRRSSRHAGAAAICTSMCKLESCTPVCK